MATVKYNPTSPARRQMSVPDFAEITKFKPEKSLIVIKKKHAGRNSYGRITVRHKGGGNKVKYRIIDFKRNTLDVPAKVLGIEYDPNRSAYIALVQYEDGTKKYVIAPVGLTDGDVIYSGADADIKPGNTLPIANIPVGTMIYNIELYPIRISISWFVLLVAPHSSWRRKTAWRRCVCLPAKCVLSV